MFITLTRIKNGKPLIVNTAHITLITENLKDYDNERTEVLVVGRGDAIWIRETPEQIMEMIENAKN